MKILISISDLSIGGAQTFAVRLANALSVNHSIYIYNYELLQKHYDSALSDQLPPDIKVIHMPLLLGWLAMKVDGILRRLNLQSIVFDYIKEIHFKISVSLIHQINIVNTHLYHSDNFVVSVLRKSKIPIIVSDHGDYRFVVEQGISTLNQVTNIMTRIDGIVYPSHSNAQVTSRYIGSCKAIEKIVYYGFSNENQNSYPESAREELVISKNALVFGMVARGICEKGWAEAIEAFEYVHSLINKSGKEVHLILVGGSDYLSSLRESLKPELVSSVHFTGYSPDPNYWIESFDVGLLPTYFPGESLPVSIIEYLSLAKPVIATEVGGIPEMLTYTEQTAGFIIHLTHKGKADVPCIIDAMLSYINNPKLLEKHSRLAKGSSEKFQMQTCVEAYESLFQQIFKGNS